MSCVSHRAKTRYVTSVRSTLVRPRGALCATTTDEKVGGSSSPIREERGNLKENGNERGAESMDKLGARALLGRTLAVNASRRDDVEREVVRIFTGQTIDDE